MDPHLSGPNETGCGGFGSKKLSGRLDSIHPDGWAPKEPARQSSYLHQASSYMYCNVRTRWSPSTMKILWDQFSNSLNKLPKQQPKKLKWNRCCSWKKTQREVTLLGELFSYRSHAHSCSKHHDVGHFPKLIHNCAKKTPSTERQVRNAQELTSHMSTLFLLCVYAIFTKIHLFCQKPTSWP